MTPWHRELVGLIEERAGYRLRPSVAAASLDRFVASRLRALGLADPMAYVALIRGAAADAGEVASLLGTVGNGHTYFFRDRRQLEQICAWLALRGGPVGLWSAGCSSGAEPYSLAMLCRDAGVEAHILATDINERSLALAAAGHYDVWGLRGVPERYRRHYVLIDGGGGTVEDGLRRSIDWLRHDLVNEAPPRPQAPDRGWTAIICRNVLLYYTPAVAESVVRRLAAALAEDGLLFLGASDALHAGVHRVLAPVPVGDIVGYQPRGTARPTRSPPAAAAAPPAVRVEQRTPPDDPYESALRLVAAGQLPAALAELTRAAAARPDDEAVWLTLGNVQLAQHAYDAALDTYLAAEAIDPLLAETRYLQGVLHRKRGDRQAALGALRGALFLDCDLWPAALLLAGLWDRLGQGEHAHREYRRALALLDAGVRPRFRSCVAGLRGIELDFSEARRRCRERLRRA